MVTTPRLLFQDNPATATDTDANPIEDGKNQEFGTVTETEQYPSMEEEKLLAERGEPKIELGVTVTVINELRH